MVEKGEITFSSILKMNLYANRDVLYSMTPPGKFLHRMTEKNQLVMELSPILLESAVSGVFIYGPPGTGKSALTLSLLGELENEARKNNVKLKTVYVNCSENRTQTVIILDMLSRLNPLGRYPRMGWTRSKAVSEFNKYVKDEESNILVVLDEVDYVLKEDGDNILYWISRVNQKGRVKISSILISNDIKVSEYLKPRTQSSLGRVRVMFNPYNSIELLDIIKDRAKYAFKPRVFSDAVLEKIAEIEASRDGDARKALELLDACAKIAMAKERKQVTLDIVGEADKSVEDENVYDSIPKLTKHQKILYLTMLKEKAQNLDGADIYKKYKVECHNFDEEPLSERRIRTFIVNLQGMGLLKSEVGWLKTLGKKSRKVSLSIDPAIKQKVRKAVRDQI